MNVKLNGIRDGGIVESVLEKTEALVPMES